MGAVILFCMMVYVLLSIGFVALVSKFTGKKKVFKYLAIAVCVLLPTWDVVLGAIIFFPACFFVPKVAIYETAQTDGIYYEGENNYIFELPKRRNDDPLSERIIVGRVSEVLQQGYEYAESKITEQHGGAAYNLHEPISPVYYRCTPLPNDEENTQIMKTDCGQIDHPTSRYMVKVNTIKVGDAEINHKKIMDRFTGKLMAEYHQTVLKFVFPFFSWYYKYEGDPSSVVCPWDANNRHPLLSRYYTFEYQVLKTIK